MASAPRLPNLNVGFLGHVDSGKTSLCRAMSVTASTAAFDKSPQSRERGITLDLGFSARVLTTEETEDPTIAETLSAAGIDRLCITMVDCPGHSTLIRTVVGGAQVIDVMVLVIDASKGVQPQTAECLVLGEVLCKPLVIALNKVDLIRSESDLAAVKKKIASVMSKTRWKSVPMVDVAADPPGNGPAEVDGILRAVLLASPLASVKERTEYPGAPEDFLMLVDHCFSIRGQGTVFTGTVQSGVVSVGDTIYLPAHQVSKKVKSLQVFKQSVVTAGRGDRVGLCVPQFDASRMERGMVSAFLPKAELSGPPCTVACIADVRRVRFHRLPCDSGTKFHVILGHTTVMGSLRFFSQEMSSTVFSIQTESISEASLSEVREFDDAQPAPLGAPAAEKQGERRYLALVLLEQPAFTYCGAKLIAMRLDAEQNQCRIAVSGTVRYIYRHSSSSPSAPKNHEEPWRQLPVYRYRYRSFSVDRVLSELSCIASVRPDVSTEAEATREAAQRLVGMNVSFVTHSGVLPTDGRQLPQSAARIPGKVTSTFGSGVKVTLVFEAPVFSLSSRKAKPKRHCDPEARGTDEDTFLFPDGAVVLELRKPVFALHSSLADMVVS